MSITLGAVDHVPSVFFTQSQPRHQLVSREPLKVARGNNVAFRGEKNCAEKDEEKKKVF